MNKIPARRCRQTACGANGSESFETLVEGVLEFHWRSLIFGQSGLELRHFARRVDDRSPREDRGDRVLVAGQTRTLKFIRIDVADQLAKRVEMFTACRG